MNKEVFQAHLSAIAEFYGKPLNSFVVGAYWKRLSDLSDREFVAACEYCINELGFMPPASKLYEVVRGSNDGKMHEEWNKAIAAAANSKRLAESGLDAISQFAIAKMGGLYLLARASDHDNQFRKKEFAALYKEGCGLAATGFLPALPPAEIDVLALPPEVSDEEAQRNAIAIRAMCKQLSPAPKKRKALEAQFKQGRKEFEKLHRSAFDGLEELTDEAIAAAAYEDGRIGATPERLDDSIYMNAYDEGMTAHARDNGVEVAG